MPVRAWPAQPRPGSVVMRPWSADSWATRRRGVSRGPDWAAARGTNVTAASNSNPTATMAARKRWRRRITCSASARRGGVAGGTLRGSKPPRRIAVYDAVSVGYPGACRSNADRVDDDKRVNDHSSGARIASRPLEGFQQCYDPHAAVDAKARWWAIASLARSTRCPTATAQAPQAPSEHPSVPRPVQCGRRLSLRSQLGGPHRDHRLRRHRPPPLPPG